jgi:aspartate-semialdehyde dehydrogenase
MATRSPASEGLCVAIVGASGAAGGDIAAAMARSPLPITAWRLYGSRGGPGGELELGGRVVPVVPLDEDAVSQGVFEGCDLVVLATPMAVSRALAPALAEEGTAVIDVGAHVLDKGVPCLPLSGVGDWARFADLRIASVPGGASAMLAALLVPLSHLGLSAARGTVLLSAGTAGRAGPEELSRQVIAMFNQSEPPRRLFPHGLAFDLNPTVGELESGWSDAERRLRLDLAAALHPRRAVVALSAVEVPLFAGVAANLHLSFAEPVSAAMVGAALAALPMVTVSERPPGPRRLVGTTGIQVGRLRDDPGGQGVHLWASADNLRMGASANVVATALHLWREGLL